MDRLISIEDVTAGYDRDYRDKKLGGPDFTHEWILKLLRPKTGKRLLDIGCGQGLLLKEAERLGLVTFGIDISSEAARLARENSPSSDISCGDAHRLGWEDGYFDYVTNIGSLEHFHHPELCLREMHRVMADGGRACVMLPNIHYYRHVINKFLRKKEPTSYQTIERFATLGEWSKLLEDNRLRIIDVHKYNKFNRPKFMVLLRTLIIPTYLSHHFVFLCSKKQDCQLKIRG